MNWIQVYNPWATWPVGAVAAIPLFILLYMLGIRRPRAPCAFFGTLAAILLLFWFGMPCSTRHGHLERHVVRLFPVVWIIITPFGSITCRWKPASLRSSKTLWPASPMTAASRPCYCLCFRLLY